VVAACLPVYDEAPDSQFAAAIELSSIYFPRYYYSDEQANKKGM